MYSINYKRKKKQREDLANEPSETWRLRDFMSVEVSFETRAPTGGRSSDMGGGRTGGWRMRVVKFTNMGQTSSKCPWSSSRPLTLKGQTDSLVRVVLV